MVNNSLSPPHYPYISEVFHVHDKSPTPLFIANILQVPLLHNNHPMLTIAKIINFKAKTFLVHVEPTPVKQVLAQL